MRRKTLAIVLLTLLLIAMAAAVSATTYYVTSRRLNVRYLPGTDEEIIGTLGYGEKVDVWNISNGWAALVYEGEVAGGFVSARCISKNKPTGEPGSYTAKSATSGSYQNFKSANYYVIVNPTNNYVNMRWEASKSSPVRKVYYYGAQLKVIAENASWCQVQDESTGEVGFMLKSLLLRTYDTVPASSAENG